MSINEGYEKESRPKRKNLGPLVRILVAGTMLVNSGGGQSKELKLSVEDLVKLGMFYLAGNDPACIRNAFGMDPDLYNDPSEWVKEVVGPSGIINLAAHKLGLTECVVHSYDQQSSPEAEELNQAREAFLNLKIDELVIEERSGEDGMSYTFYKLPHGRQSDPYWNAVAGLFSRNYHGERMPEGTVMVVPHFPVGTKMTLGNENQDRFRVGMSEPSVHVADIALSPAYPPFTDNTRKKSVIDGKVGNLIMNGEVVNNTVFLTSDRDGKISVQEWKIGTENQRILGVQVAIPAFWVFPDETEDFDQFVSVRLLAKLVSEQAAYLETKTPMVSEPSMGMVGPTAIFRSNGTETDLVIVSPFLLLNQELFKEMLMQTPFPDGNYPVEGRALFAAFDYADYGFESVYGTLLGGKPVDVNEGEQKIVTDLPTRDISRMNLEIFIPGAGK
jgi:hypothetical protein